MSWHDYVTCVDVRARQKARECRNCGKPNLEPRRVTCSTECVEEFARNHFWGAARWACVLRADYRCERCGADFGEVRDGKRQERVSKPRHWGEYNGPSGLQVNHIEPLRGSNRTANCANHQDNLEALCTLCHQAETERLFRPHIAARRAAQPRLIEALS